MKIDPSRVRVKVAPAESVISVEDAKLHLRLDHDDEDELIASLIEAATLHCEDVARRAFVTRTLVGELDCWPMEDRITLPYSPAVSVVGITYIDEAGNSHTFDASNYLVNVNREPGLIILRRNVYWPTDELLEVGAIAVEWVAGYGDAEDVPATYKAAVKLVLADLYENREAVNVAQGLSISTNPTIDRLLMTDRGY